MLFRSREYGLDVQWAPVRIHTQSGDDRYVNVDKMILKQAGFMPHGLINNAAELIGSDGAKFVGYAKWVCERIRDIGEPGYRPTLRFDVYGTLGDALDNDPARIVEVLAQVRAVTEPLDLFVEMPVEMASEAEQFRSEEHTSELRHT